MINIARICYNLEACAFICFQKQILLMHLWLKESESLKLCFLTVAPYPLYMHTCVKVKKTSWDPFGILLGSLRWNCDFLLPASDTSDWWVVLSIQITPKRLQKLEVIFFLLLKFFGWLGSWFFGELRVICAEERQVLNVGYKDKVLEIVISMSKRKWLNTSNLLR